MPRPYESVPRASLRLVDDLARDDRRLDPQPFVKDHKVHVVAGSQAALTASQSQRGSRGSGGHLDGMVGEDFDPVSLLPGKYRLRVHALPKDYSPLVLRSPLHATGTFKHPKVRPDQQLFVKATVAAVLGALVNPLLSLVPLIETAPGKDEDCQNLVAAVERHTGQSISFNTTAAPQVTPKQE